MDFFFRFTRGVETFFVKEMQFFCWLFYEIAIFEFPKGLCCKVSDDFEKGGENVYFLVLESGIWNLFICSNLME